TTTSVSPSCLSLKPTPRSLTSPTTQKYSSSWAPSSPCPTSWSYKTCPKMSHKAWPTPVTTTATCLAVLETATPPSTPSHSKTSTVSVNSTSPCWSGWTTWSN